MSVAMGETHGKGKQKEISRDPEGVKYSTLSGSGPDFACLRSMGFTHGY
jgi:hypothetical protein